MFDFKKLTEQMGNLHRDQVLSFVHMFVDTNQEHPQDVLNALSDGMAIVSHRFDDLEYFVGDLIYAGDIFTEAIQIVKPLFNQENTTMMPVPTKVVLATVEGDLHDIGKNIVKVVLEAKGFEVVDLGVNVSPSVIVQRTIEEQAKIVALSAVMTMAVNAMQQTVDAFKSAGIRDQVSIVIGGACTNARIAKEIKADFYGKTPDDTAAFCSSVSNGI